MWKAIFVSGRECPRCQGHLTIHYLPPAALAAGSMCPGQTFISPISFSWLGGHQKCRYCLATSLLKLFFLQQVLNTNQNASLLIFMFPILLSPKIHHHQPLHKIHLFWTFFPCHIHKKASNIKVGIGNNLCVSYSPNSKLQYRQTLHQCSANSSLFANILRIVRKDSSRIYSLIFRSRIDSYSSSLQFHFMNIISIRKYTNLTNIIPIHNLFSKYSWISYSYTEYI